MPELQLAPIKKLIKEAGAERASEAAATRLREIIEKTALVIAADAVKFAKHAGRETVRKSDIDLAAKDIVAIIGVPKKPAKPVKKAPPKKPKKVKKKRKKK